METILQTLDWCVLGAYMLLTLGIGLAFRKANRGSEDFFVSGRKLSWWLAGTSMVATTFAADTPLAVTGIVARDGVAGNWIWWGMLPGALATTFFFSALWRRSRLITDAELVAIRYGGRPARFLRSFRAVYFGLLVNATIMGWVNLAMATILGEMLDINQWSALALCLSVTVAYSTLSGLTGIVATDFIQFILGMGRHPGPGLHCYGRGRWHGWAQGRFGSRRFTRQR